jgi:hypothetical protein
MTSHLTRMHSIYTLLSTSGGRSVGIVRSRAKGHGVCLFVSGTDQLKNVLVAKRLTVSNLARS